MQHEILLGFLEGTTDVVSIVHDDVKIGIFTFAIT
jgi:hypothetical protein